MQGVVRRSKRTELQELSKEAFGHEHRLTLARELLASDSFATVDSLAGTTGIPISTLHRELGDLEELGTVDREDDRDGARFRRNDSAFWEWCRELLRAVPTVA